MSIYQCDNCGCAENTALGWYHCRNSQRLTKAKYLGKKLCSVCAPTEYPSGESINNMNGEWHGHFERTFLPHGSCFTNEQGNLQHIDSGLVGSEIYSKYGKDDEYAK